MKKNIFIITLLVGCCSLSAWAQKQEKTITVEVNNNWNRAKTDEPVVINLRDLHTGFKVKSAVVMEGSTEIPSQLDDLNRDRKMDELAFVTSLPAHGRKTFQVTLSSEKSTKTYPARVYAEMFIADPRKGKHQSVQAITVPGTSNIYSMVRPHGPVLESELVGYRLYFNEKQTPDIYGKFNKGLEIKESQFYPTDEQLARGFGDDVLRVFDSCGPGAFKGWDGKKATHITPVATRTERIISYGPVRVIAEIEVTGWKYQNAELDMMTRYTLYAGHRDLRIEAFFDEPIKNEVFCTGVQDIVGQVVGTTAYPTSIGQASMFDVGLVEEICRQTALEMRATGSQWTFNPNVEVARDPRWGRVGETFGEDPYLVSLLGVASVRGYQGDGFGKAENVLACAKHFIGGSQPINGTNGSPTDISERTLREVFLPPFKAAVDAGVYSFMTAHNELNGIPCHANPWLMEDILRKEWGFDGFIVSDWMDIEHIHDLHRTAVDNPR